MAHRFLALTSVFCLTVLFLSGCGGPSSTVLGSGSVSITLVRHAVSAKISTDPNLPSTATAQCQPGEYLVNGGYASSAYSDGSFIWNGLIGSYPSDANGLPSQNPTAWTVKINQRDEGGAFLTVYAYCIHSPSVLTTLAKVQTSVVATDSQEPQFFVPCPAGTTRTGGGFNVDLDTGSIGINMAYPKDPDTWVVGVVPIEANVGSETISAFAVCVSSTQLHLTTSMEMQNTPFQSNIPTPGPGSPPPSPNGETAIGSLSCQSNQLLVGGGFDQSFVQNEGSFVYDDQADQNLTAWQIAAEAGPDASANSINVYAVCLTIS